MNDTPRPSQSDSPRVLIYSQRNLLSILPFRCAHFEFENIITQIDSADIIAPRIDPSNLRHIVAKRIAYHSSLALNPGIQRIPIERDYELFLAICGDPTDLLRLSALGDWRSRCRKSVCLIDELWVTQMDSYHSFLRLLESFDVVMLYYNQSVGPLGKRIGSQCAYLPPGVDTIRFCPYPTWPKRVIDVYSVGRRSKITHGTLLKMVQEKGLFYLHDSLTANQVIDPMEHRALFANLAKRSRYFIVNPGLIDRRDIRGDQIEIGDRYFEAAASGAIMLGERPDNPEFANLFGWPDSMIHLPFDSPDIDMIVKTLDKDPEGQGRMQRRNAKEALMRHDWAYRWEEILGAVGLEPMPELFQRKERLRQLAEDITHGEITSGQDVSDVISKQRSFSK